MHPELNREIDARNYSVTLGDRYCRHSAPTRDGAVNAGRWLFRWPNLALNLYPNAMVVERIQPLGSHATRIVYNYFFLDPDDPDNDGVLRISKTVVERYARAAAAEPDPLAGLTARQREILQLVAEGKSSKEIAAMLELSIKTVESHRGQIMERLGVHDVTGLVRFAIRVGLVSPDS